MPWFSFSKASVCLSVTCSPPVSLRLDFASFSNCPRANHITFVVDYPLEGISRLVSNPAHEPTFFIYVLFFRRQIAEVADELFSHDLAVLVDCGLDDVPQLVDRTPHGLVLSVGAVVGYILGLFPIFSDASCSVGGLGFTLVLGVLSSSVL